jgi:hypothetical protein
MPAPARPGHALPVPALGHTAAALLGGGLVIVVTELTRTCTACPAQWEGRTADGKHVYVRYRWGWLKVGLGATLDDAVDDDGISLQLGDEYHGFLEYADLIEATKDLVSWPGAAS